MLPRERILKAVNRQKPDRVPMDLPDFNREALRIFKEKTGSDDPIKYFGVERDFESVSFKPTREDTGKYYQYHRTDFKNAVTYNEWGTAFEIGSNPAFDHVVAPLTYINTEKELDAYPMPDFMSSYRHKHLAEDVQRIKRKGLAVVAYMEMTIFEVAWQIRGFDELMCDFLLNESLADSLLDRITDIRVAMARRYAESGVDILRTGDDVGMQANLMMSVDLWRKHLKPRLKKVFNAAKEANPEIKICYHSDGYIEPIIEDLVEIGLDILNPVQPECMDPLRLKQQYGERLSFWGTIGIQRTLPFGTPEDVVREVRERIETVGKGGGLVIGPTHVIAPEVPYENIFAFVKAVKEYGKYRYGS